MSVMYTSSSLRTALHSIYSVFSDAMINVCRWRNCCGPWVFLSTCRPSVASR